MSAIQPQSSYRQIQMYSGATPDRSTPKNDAPLKNDTEIADAYVKTEGANPIYFPKGAIPNGEGGWILPPDALKPLMDTGERIIDKTDITLSFKDENGVDAKIKGVLLREAVEYSDIVKNQFKLLGITAETFKTTFKAEGQVDVRSALSNGTFFNTSLSGYAASYSISTKYTYDKRFQEQYNQSPSKTIDYHFNSLNAMMKSLVIKQNPDGGTSTYFRES